MQTRQAICYTLLKIKTPNFSQKYELKYNAAAWSEIVKIEKNREFSALFTLAFLTPSPLTLFKES